MLKINMLRMYYIIPWSVEFTIIMVDIRLLRNVNTFCSKSEADACYLLEVNEIFQIISERCLFCSPRLHLFDRKHCKKQQCCEHLLKCNLFL